MIDDIFRAYDIRGVYPKELDASLALKIAQVFGSLAKGPVSLGRDARITGPLIESAIATGLSSVGVDVIEAGMLPTPVLNFFTMHNAKSGIIVSASHNPPEYAGIRFRNQDGSGWTSCIEEIKNVLKSGNQINEVEWNKVGKVSSIDPKQTIAQYADELTKKVKLERKLKVVLDPGNGAVCGIAADLFKRAGCEVTEINNVVDGLFPDRGPNPNDKTLEKLKKEVVSKKADFGVAYDGDGDRCVIVDNTGYVLDAADTGILIIRNLIERGQKVALNVECSLSVEEETKKRNGEVVRIRVGDVFLAEAAKKENAVFAMESSNHYLISKLFPFDDGIAISFYFASMLSKSNTPLSELIKSVPKYPRMQAEFPCPDQKKFAVIDKLKGHFKGYKITDIDGIKMDFEDGWALIRVSNTQPLLRLTIEAKTDESVNQIERTIAPAIKRFL